MKLQAGDIARWWFEDGKRWGDWLLILDKNNDSLEVEKLFSQLTVMYLETGRIDDNSWWEGAAGGHWEIA